MTAPLTPPDCDLRAFATMPLDAVRLFGSEFHAVASDGAWRAGVTLWLRAWHQVPAASLPDDDVQLTRLAELGRDIKEWKRLRDQALHGWIKCSDGRLYHPVVAEIANGAWKKRQAFKERSAKANEKRWGDNKEADKDAKAILVGDQQALLADPKERESKGKGEERDKEEGSVAKATGAEAPKLDLANDPPEPVRIDPAKALFDAGVRLLVERDGVTDKAARSRIGQLRSRFSDGEVMQAVTEAIRRPDLSEASSWIQGRLEKRKSAAPAPIDARAAASSMADRWAKGK